MAARRTTEHSGDGAFAGATADFNGDCREASASAANPEPHGLYPFDIAAAAAAAAAIDRLLSLAPHPNIFVKILAAPRYSTTPYQYKNIQKLIRQTVDGFGAPRCFRGSDLTRLPAMATYKGCVRMFAEQADFLIDAELEDVVGIASPAAWAGP